MNKLAPRVAVGAFLLLVGALPIVVTQRAVVAEPVIESSETIQPFDPAGVPVFDPSSVGAYAPDQAGIARVYSENWERSDALRPNHVWRTFDPFVSQPSINDQIEWGRSDCVASNESWSLWSVGAGAFGSTLGCKETYPSPLPFRENGVRTELQFLFVDMANVTDPQGGIRVTFDYMSQMPAQAMFVGAGEFQPGGETTIFGTNDFVTDTAGDWVRGKVVEIKNTDTNPLVGKSRVLLAWIYSDPPPRGEGSPSSNSFGVYIDNIHVDVMFVNNPGFIPSPSPTPRDPDTPTPTPTNTPPVIVIPTTTTPMPTAGIMLPVNYNKFDSVLRTPQPTAPTPTVTPTSPPTPTLTPTPTETLAPTNTPTNTPVPTFTPVPEPNVRISIVAALADPEIIEVTNYGTAPQSLDNWRIFEKKKGTTCNFPNGVVLGPSETFQILAGRGATPGEGVAVCDDRNLILDNNLNEVQLWNERNRLVDRWCYDRNGNFPCEEELRR